MNDPFAHVHAETSYVNRPQQCSVIITCKGYSLSAPPSFYERHIAEMSISVAFNNKHMTGHKTLHCGILTWSGKGGDNDLD